MIFHVVVKNADGSLEFDVPFTTFKITDELNKGKTATFRFELEVVKEVADAYGTTVLDMFAGSYREIEVYDADDNKIYAGYISDDPILSAGKDDKGSLFISSKGFFGLLEKRWTDNLEEYVSTDASDIAWGLINTTQSNGSYGDFGITRGANPTTKDRDRTYRFRNIADSIQKLSNDEVKDGFDFDIDNDKKFNVYYPTKGSQRPNIVLEEGFNIDGYSIYRTFIDSMVNQVYVLGEGQGDDILYVQRDADNAYKSAFFLLQNVITEKEIITTDTLNDKGDVELEKYQEPRFVFKSVDVDYAEPDYNNYDIGDELKIKIPSYGINDFYRVVKRTCDQDGNVVLSFSEI